MNLRERAKETINLMTPLGPFISQEIIDYEPLAEILGNDPRQAIKRMNRDNNLSEGLKIVTSLWDFLKYRFTTPLYFEIFKPFYEEVEDLWLRNLMEAPELTMKLSYKYDLFKFVGGIGVSLQRDPPDISNTGVLITAAAMGFYKVMVFIHRNFEINPDYIFTCNQIRGHRNYPPNILSKYLAFCNNINILLYFKEELNTQCNYNYCIGEAISSGNIEIVEYFLSFDASIPLDINSCCDIEMLKYIINRSYPIESKLEVQCILQNLPEVFAKIVGTKKIIKSKQYDKWIDEAYLKCNLFMIETLYFSTSGHAGEYSFIKFPELIDVIRDLVFLNEKLYLLDTLVQIKSRVDAQNPRTHRAKTSNDFASQYLLNSNQGNVLIELDIKRTLEYSNVIEFLYIEMGQWGFYKKENLNHLYDIIKYSSSEVIIKLLDNLKSINDKTVDTFSYGLAFALAHGRLDIVDYILSRGLNFNSEFILSNIIFSSNRENIRKNINNSIKYGVIIGPDSLRSLYRKFWDFDLIQEYLPLVDLGVASGADMIEEFIEVLRGGDLKKIKEYLEGDYYNYLPR